MKKLFGIVFVTLAIISFFSFGNRLSLVYASACTDQGGSCTTGPICNLNCGSCVTGLGCNVSGWDACCDPTGGGGGGNGGGGGGPFCGDGVCNNAETCGTCPGDCGACVFACTSGGCGGCGGGTEPANTCGTTGGTQTCTNNAVQVCYNNSYTQNCTYGYSNCSANFTCPGGGGHVACVTHLNVHVYKDYDHDGAIDSFDEDYPGISVNDGGGAQTTNANGDTTFTNEQTGNYTVTATIPGGWDNSNQNPRPVTINNGNGNLTINFGMTPLFSISGTVFYDLNENGKKDAGESGVQQGTVKVNGNTITVNANGTYTDTNLWSGNYTVSYTAPAGYQTIYPTANYAVTVGTPGKTPACNDGNYNDDSCTATGSIANLNIAVTPLHTIAGTVYDDINESTYFDGPDTSYTAGGTITYTGAASGTTALSTINGTYTAANLPSGQYTLTYSPPANYHAVYPVPPQFTVTVGGPVGSATQPCNANNYHDASCNATGNITGLNYGISNSNDWTQGVCTDLRVDGSTAGGGGGNGFTDIIPSSANCGGTASPYAVITNTSGGANNPYSTTACDDPGVVYTGNIDANFGEGAANVNNWVVGGNTYGELFTPRTQGVIATSYDALTANFNRTGSTTTDLATVCTLNNCTLPANLADGIYQANGNVTLNAYTFPTSTSTDVHSYIFHINGTLTINGNLIVPAGTAALFSTTGNIFVDPSVGEATVTSTDGNVEGLFTTDQSFIIESAYTAGQHCDFTTGNPKDLKLNIQGVVIVNAANTGGTFQEQRELCSQNRSCPTATIANRADMLLSLPLVNRNTNSLFQETAP